PGQIVVVVEGIVGKDLRISICTQITYAVVDALSREAHILLSAKRDADLLIAGVPEESGWIAGDTVVPANPREAKAGFIDDRRRECVNKTCASNLRGIGVVVGKIDRNDGRRVVAARALRIEPRNLVLVARSPVDLEIFLVVRNVAGLRAHKVSLNQSVPSVFNGYRRPVGQRV